MNTRDFNQPVDDDDDLPITVRRARQERAAQLAPPTPAEPAPTATVGGLGPLNAPPQTAYTDEPYDDRVTVTRFDVPFFRLVTFFLKAVIAAIPALILLGAILYGAGVLLRTYFPWIVQTQITITFPN